MDRRVICVMTFLAVAGSDVRAQMAAGNARDGQTVAQQVCSECHATRAGQTSPNSKSPISESTSSRPAPMPYHPALPASTPSGPTR